MSDRLAVRRPDPLAALPGGIGVSRLRVYDTADRPAGVVAPAAQTHRGKALPGFRVPPTLQESVCLIADRPGPIIRTFAVELPTHRDYAQVMSDPRFDRLATDLRGLLGSAAANH